MTIHEVQLFHLQIHCDISIKRANCNDTCVFLHRLL